MKWTVLSLIILSLLNQTLPAASPKPVQRVVDLTSTLTPLVQRHNLPAMAAAVVRQDQIVAQGVTGLRAWGSLQKVTPGDKFHLGSNTKAMTATLCAMLVEQGKLSWTTTLGQTFPELKATMHPDYAKVTLEQLLTSTGGFPSEVEPTLWRRLYTQSNPTAARRLLLVESTRAAPAYSPGSAHIYSNTSFAVAGHMAEKVMGMAWEELMRQRLFSRLKMTSAGFGAPGTSRSIDQPRGHSADGKPVNPGPGSDNPMAIAPAGTVHASLGDYASFVSLHLAGTANGASTLLKPESFAKLHTPASGSDYAMGWLVATRGWSKGPVLTHAGTNTMWYAVVWMAPKEEFAVIVMTNKGGPDAEQACDDAAGALIEWALKNR